MLANSQGGRLTGQADEQSARAPFPVPRVHVRREPAPLVDFRREDVELVDYRCHPAIRAAVSV